MKRNLIKSGLVGAFALALTAGAALAQPGNSSASALQQSSAADGQLMQVRGDFHGGGGHGGGSFHGGGGFHGGGSHGHHAGGVRNGFDFFVGPSYYGDDYYGYDNCRWSLRYHREICY